MLKTNYLNISPKEYRVMLALFEYRGATIDQLLNILGYNKSGITNMYKPIQTLNKLGYISAYAISPKRSKKIYFLTSKGYSKMLEQLAIPYQYNGMGFNKDYGDFPYELYKPPNDLKTHHLLLVDFLIEANKFKQELGKTKGNNHIFDFRDNRYASREYKKKIKKEGALSHYKTYRFRPDAEIEVMSNTCFIEIDLGTERGQNLTKKFEGYKEYFEYLVSQNKELPSSIIFISEEMQNDAQKNRRWQSISKRFLETLEEYATTVNLIYESIDKIQEVFTRIYTSDEFRRNALANIRDFDKPNGTPIKYIDPSRGFKWGKVSFAISNSTLYPFESIEGYETKGWMLLWKYKEYIENEHIRVNGTNGSKAIPILLYKNKPPKPIQYIVKMDTQGFFNNHLLFKSRGEFGVWQNKDFKEFRENPLTEKVVN